MSRYVYDLPIWQTITSAWEKTKGAKAAIWLGIFILVICSVVAGFVIVLLKEATPIVGGIGSFIIELFLLLVMIGLYYIGACKALGRPVTYYLMFRSLEWPYSIRIIGVYFLKYVIMFLCSLIIFIPAFIISKNSGFLIIFYVLCAIALIYFLTRFSLAMMFVLVEKAGPIEALKLSWQATRANFWNLIAIWFLLIIFITLSAIPLGIGLIWSIPFAYVSWGEIYKNLLENVRLKGSPRSPEPS